MASDARMIPASMLEAEKVKYERRSQKVLGILNKKDERIAELERQLDQNRLRKELQGSKKREGELREKVNDQSEQIEVLIAEVANLRQNQNVSKERSQEFKEKSEQQLHKLATVEVELEKSKEAIETYEKANAKLDKEKEALAEQVEKLREFLRQAKSTCESLEAKVESQEKLLATARKTALDGETQLARAREKIKRLTEKTVAENPSEQKARQLELQLRNLSNNLLESEKREKELENVIRELEKRRQEEEKAYASERHAAFENMIVEQSEELVSLRSQLVRCGARERKLINEAEFEKRTMLNKIRTLEHRLRRNSENGIVQRKQLETTIRVLSGKSDLHSKLSEMSENLSALKVEKLDLEAKVVLLEDELKTVKKTAEASRVSLEAMERDLNSFRLSSVYADMPPPAQNIMIQRLAKEKEDYKQRLEQLETKMDSGNAITTSMNDSLRMIDETRMLEVDEDETDYSLPMSQTKQQRTFARLRFRIRGLEVQLRGKAVNIENLEKRIASLVETQKSEQMAHADTFLQLEKQHSDQLNTINRRVISHVREKQLFMEEKEKLSKELEISHATQRELEKKLAKLKEDHMETVKSMTRKNESLTTELEQLQSTLKVEKRCRDNDKARLVYLEELVDVLQNQTNNANVGEQERLAVELTSKLEAVMKASNEMEVNFEGIQEKLKHNEAQLKRLKERNRELEQDLEETISLRKDEVNSNNELRARFGDRDRELAEARNSLMNTELQLIDAQVNHETVVAERDHALEEVARLRRQFELDLKAEHKASLEKIREYELKGPSGKQIQSTTEFETRKEQLQSILRQIIDGLKQQELRESNSIDPTTRAFERLAELVIESEKIKLKYESEISVLEWNVSLLQGKYSSLATTSESTSSAPKWSILDNAQMQRLFQMERSLQQMHFERRIKCERERADALEKLFFRANAQRRARISSSENVEEPHDILAELHALTERNIYLESELAEARMRYEQLRACSDGEDEKRKVILEREKRNVDSYKAEVLMLRDQLQSCKKDLVNVAFEYETKLMANSNAVEDQFIHRKMDSAEFINDIRDLQNQVIEKTKEMESAHTKIMSLQEELASTSSQASILHEQLNHLEQENIVLKQQQRESAEKEKREERDTTIKERLEELTKQTSSVLLEQKDKQISRLRAEADILSKRLQEATDVNRTLTVANEKVVSTLHKFEKRIEKERKRREENNQAVVANTSSICSRLESYLETIGFDNEEELRTAIESLHKVLARFGGQSDLMEAQSTLKEYEHKIDRLTSELENRDKEYEAKMGEWKVSVEKKKSELESMDTSLKDVYHENETLSGRMKIMQSEYQSVLKERDSLIADLEQLRSEFTETNRDNALLRKKLDDYEHEIEDLQHQENDLRIQLDVQTVELDDLRERIQKHNTTEAELEKIRAEQDMQVKSKVLAEVQSRETQLQTKLEALDKRLTNTKQSLQRKSEQLKAMKASWIPPEAAEQFKKDISKLKNDLKKAKQQTAKKQQMLSATQDKKSQEKETELNLQKKLSKVETRCKMLEHELQTKESLLQSFKASAEEYRSKNEGLQKEAEKLQARVETIQRERSSLRQKVSMLQVQVSQSKEDVRAENMRVLKASNHQNQQQESDNKEQRLQEKVGRLKRKVGNLETQLETMKQQNLVLGKENSELKRVLDSIKQDQSGSRQKLKALETELRKVREEAEELENLAKMNQAETVSMEHALCAALCRIADETVEVKKKIYDVSSEKKQDKSLTIASQMASMLDLSSDDVADIFGAEARFNDPVFNNSMEQIRTAITRHKAFINHLFSSRGGQPTRLSAYELEKVVNNTCILWRL